MPGIFGPKHEPYLLRNDYVTNSNDSFWLANPHQPLTGFARIIGTENTARTLRTRIGLLEVQARIDGTDGQGPPGFTLAAMKRLDLSDIDYAAQLTLPALVKLCDKFQAAGGSAPTSTGGKVQARRRLHHAGPLEQAAGTPPSAARSCSASSGTSPAAPRRRRSRTGSSWPTRSPRRTG